MITVSVCVGSSCHIKGSYQVVKIFGELIKKNELENFVTLKASFCMGRCMDGISVMVDDRPVQHVGFVNAEQIFYKEIFPQAQQEKLNSSSAL